MQGSAECVYDLYAVSNHVGSLGGGHYTAYCRVPQPDGSLAWYHFDDELVSQVVSQNAYQLFYVRRHHLRDL